LDGRILRLSAPLFHKTIAQLDAAFALHGNVEEIVETRAAYLVEAG
jgi:hypothetical protein